jgi:hypothetical protein
MTPRIDEVATDLYRICLYVPEFDLQFNHFLIRDADRSCSIRACGACFRPSARRWLHSSILQVSAGSAGATSRWTTPQWNESSFRRSNSFPPVQIPGNPASARARSPSSYDWSVSAPAW